MEKDTHHTTVTWEYFFQTIEETIEYLKLAESEQSQALGRKIDFAFTHLPMLPTRKPRQNKFRE